MITRRHLLGTAGAGAALAVSGLSPKFSEAEAAGVSLTPGVPEGVSTAPPWQTLPGKKPLIKLSDRPPNYETPLEYLRTPITPNDEFFVRYHLADIPTGQGRRLQDRSRRRWRQWHCRDQLEDLKKMPAVEVVAVNQCSGNRRGLSKPHVRRRMGIRRHGLRALEGRQAQGYSRQGRAQEGSDRDRLRWRRWTVGRRDARLHQEHSRLEGDRGVDDHRLRDERPAVAALQRLSCAARRAGLDRHLLDEARHRDQRADQAARRVLDEPGLSHSARQIPAQGPLHHAGNRDQYADHRDGGEFADHQPSRRRQGESGQGHRQRHGLGRRLRHQSVQVSTDGGKTWSSGDARSGSRPLRVPAWSFDLTAKKGKNP